MVQVASTLSSYVGLVPYYSGSIARSLMFPVGNTVHRHNQRVTFLRVGFCSSHLFHPAFLIDDQSLQEGCVISRSFNWLGIAPNVRRSVVSVSTHCSSPPVYSRFRGFGSHHSLLGYMSDGQGAVCTEMLSGQRSGR